MELYIPPVPAYALERLHGAGYEAYAVGGCVRDSLLGQAPHDWDITTSATPEQMEAVFAGERLLETGRKHGTLTLVREGCPVEMTTYRVELGYSDGRRPDQVRFTGRLTKDLARRDFTVNAMAYCPGEGLVDVFGGREDLEAGLIRCVGEPEKRFGEDALRILRALRFASTLDFALDERTAAAVHAQRDLLGRVAAQRLFSELKGLLMGGGVLRVLLDYPDVLERVIPELGPAVGFEQHSVYHCYDVWEHTARAVAACPPHVTLRLAMLFHDLGKPFSFTLVEGAGHFYGHAAKSQELAHNALGRLRCDRATAEAVEMLVRYHDAPIEASRRAVGRWLTRLGGEGLRRLLAVHRADNAAQSAEWDHTPHWDALEEILDGLLAEEACFSLSQLAVNGRDILALGRSGPRVGQILRTLLEEVVDGRLPNEREALLGRAGEL